MMALYQAVALGPSQRERAASVLARAFQDDILYRYIVPDEGKRARALPHMCDFALTHALVHGEVYTTPELAGVACWLPPGKTDLTLWRVLRSSAALVRNGFALPRAFLSLGRESWRRNQAVTEHVTQVHKRLMTAPHWHLTLLGVDPDFQRRGVGATLLQPVLARADAVGVPCFLETQTESNVRFYERQGFRVAHDGEVPGHPLRMWSMVREAAG